MAYTQKIKRKKYLTGEKYRSPIGITPSGYEFEKYDSENKRLVYKKKTKKK